MRRRHPGAPRERGSCPWQPRARDLRAANPHSRLRECEKRRFYLLSRPSVRKGEGDVTTFPEIRPVETRFRITPELAAGAIYRKYEKASRKIWDPKLLDYEQDRADWERMTDAQREGIVTITVRFEAGEQE